MVSAVRLGQSVELLIEPLLLFGIKVSGMSLDVTALRFVSKEGMELIHGGLFGLEGGIGITIVLLIGIGLLLFTGEQQPAKEKV